MKLRRVLALVIDGCVVSAAAALLFFPLSSTIEKHGNLGNWCLLGLTLLYFSFFDSRFSAKGSLGKRCLRIRIHGSSPLEPWQAMLRKLLVLFPLQNGLFGTLPIFTDPNLAPYTGIPFFAAIGFCVVGVFGFAIFSKSQRGIHDYMFKTQIVKVDDASVPLYRLSRPAMIVLGLAALSGAMVPSLLNKQAEAVLEPGELSQMQDMQKQLAAIGYEGVGIQDVSFKTSDDRKGRRTLQLTIPVSHSTYDEAYKRMAGEKILPLLREKFVGMAFDGVAFTYRVNRFVGMLQLNYQETDNHPFR